MLQRALKSQGKALEVAKSQMLSINYSLSNAGLRQDTFREAVALYQRALGEFQGAVVLKQNLTLNTASIVGLVYQMHAQLVDAKVMLQRVLAG